MFDVKAPATFAADLTIVGQGREQKLPVVFRHKTRTEYGELLNKVIEGKVKDADAVLSLLDSWEANADLCADSLKALDEAQPGALWAIINGYAQALRVAQKGN